MPRKAGDPNFSIDDKARAVAILQTEANGNLSLAERLTGVGRDTIRAAVKDPEIAELAGIKKQEIGLKLNTLLGKLIDRYDAQVEDADLANKGVTLLGIVADKALLYADQPNQIVQQQTDAGPYLKQLISRGFGEDEAKMILEEAERRRKEYGG